MRKFEFVGVPEKIMDEGPFWRLKVEDGEDLVIGRGPYDEILEKCKGKKVKITIEVRT